MGFAPRSIHPAFCCDYDDHKIAIFVLQIRSSEHGSINRRMRKTVVGYEHNYSERSRCRFAADSHKWTNVSQLFVAVGGPREAIIPGVVP
jgi:hypothetical protein